MRNLYIATGIILAGLAGTFSYQTGQPKSASTQPATGLRLTGINRKKPQDGPLASLCSAVARPIAAPNTAPDGSVRPSGAKREEDDGPESCVAVDSDFKAGLKIVVAFVPDPETTVLRLYFDRALEAIQWAAQDGGYNFYSYWLPWSATAEPEFSTLEDRKLAEEDKKRRQRLPGVLVFRGSARDTGLAIFLVGESPTRGMNRDQFSNALRYQHELAPTDLQVHLLGPCYSGSLDILRSQIQDSEFNHGFKDFRILSGSATSPDAGRHFQQAFETKSKDGPNADYHSLVHDDLLSAIFFQKYLRNQLHYRDTLAILSEGDTVFGSFFDFAAPSLKRFYRKPEDAGITDVVGIRFPRGISHLRSAYQNDPALSQVPLAPDATMQRRTLQLSLKDSQEARDTLPEFAEQTPVSHESELAQIADILQHQRIRFAGIVASDELDVLFVSRFLRTAAPDARLVLFDTDLLSTRQMDGFNLVGVLAVTTYPLFPSSQRWVKAPQQRRRIAFSSRFEEGMYNAATATLKSGANGAAPLFDYERPEHNEGRPPIWFTAIGHDSFWPIALLTEAGDLSDPRKDPLLWSNKTGGSNESGFRFLPEPAPRIWGVLLLFGLIASSWYLIASRHAQKSKARWCSDLALGERGEGTARAFYQLALTLAGVVLWLTFASGPLGFLASRVIDPRVAASSVIVLIVVAFLLKRAIGLSVHIFKNSIAETHASTRAYRFLVILPWLVFGAYAAFAISILKPDPHYRSFFFAYRSEEFGSGVCPSLPLLFLFLALCLWGFVQLQRVIFAQERYQRLPVLGRSQDSDPICETVEKLDHSFQDALALPSLFPVSVALFTLVLVFLIGLQSMGSLEGELYDRFFVLSVATLASLLSLAVLRFWTSWKLLARILEQLELHPLRKSFGGLPQDYSWSPIWQQSPRKRSYVLLSRATECLRQLRHLSSSVVPVADCELEARATLFLGFAVKGEREPAKVYEALQTSLRDTAQELAAELTRDYWQRGSSQILQKAETEESTKEALRMSKEEFEKEKPNLLAEEFVALRFLAYIRYAMVQLRNLLTFVTFGFVLLTLSLGSYPFQSPHVIAGFLTVSLIAIAMPVIWAFMEMERDAILSRITDTRAGKLDGGFYLRAVSFGALPVLSVLASHFPSIGQYLSSWVQPALKALH